MSQIGPSRHFAAMQHFGRFRSEADMDRQAKRVGSVENDPSRHFATVIDALRKVYSITSSAIASNDGGTSMLSALAVFRLITSSNLVD